MAFHLAAWTCRMLRERDYFRETKAPDLARLLALVAVGTVADMVPLTGSNRLLVHAGLKRLERRQYAGLRVLIDRVHEQQREKEEKKRKKQQNRWGGSNAPLPAPPITERTIGFDIAPRLNAAGRLADADLAWRLLVTDDEAEAQQLFEELDALNKKRRATQKETVDAVMRKVKAASHLPDFIVAYDADWHPGVVGLAAGRLADLYHRPAAVIGQGGKGSARAPEGLNLVAVLAEGLVEEGLERGDRGELRDGRLVRYGGDVGEI